MGKTDWTATKIRDFLAVTVNEERQTIIVFANEVKQSSNYTFINENLKNFLGARAFKNFVPKGYYDIDWGNFEDKYNIAKLNLE